MCQGAQAAGLYAVRVSGSQQWRTENAEQKQQEGIAMMDVSLPKKERIEKVRREKNALFLEQETGLIRLWPQTDTAVRISFTQDGTFEKRQGEVYADLSDTVSWDWEEEEERIILRTGKLRLLISRETGSIRYEKPDGTLLLKERESQSRQMERFSAYRTVANDRMEVEEVVTPDGVKKRIKAADQEFDADLYHTRVYFDFQPREVLLGLGQDEAGVWNLRNTTRYGHQANRKIAIPMFASSRQYGILSGTQSAFLFCDTAQYSYLQTEADSFLDYYFLGGEGLFEVVRDFRRLTGKAVLLPEWTFGYIQSQERYESAEELLATAKEFREKQIGLDCLVLDWMSWEDGKWGQKSFDPVRFPDPAGLMEGLHEQQVHFMLSIWPNMSKETENYKEFAEKKLLLPGTEIYDAFSEKARQLYWKQAKEKLFDFGIDAWWCDSSEPLTPEWERRMEPEAGELYREYVEQASKVMPADRINAFGLYHAEGIWEGQRGTDSGRRVMNLTRSGWAGSQRYGTVLWSGDIAADWNTLKSQIAAGLQFSASGLPYWTLDIGAFFVKKGIQWFWNGEYPEGIADAGYRELYVRWFQYGAFLPVFRAHGTDIRREPWQFGEEGDPFYEALKGAIRLRYSLLPYLYSLAAKTYFEDGMIMRPLLFDFPEDERVFLISDQYMLGDALMVCPVAAPMYYEQGGRSIEERTQKFRSVYLPMGNDWYDWDTGERYQGGQVVEVSAPLSKIPVFVKAGSIVPTKEAGQNSAAMRGTPVCLKIYPGRDASFTLYEDAGDGYGYEEGAYCMTRISWDDSAGSAHWMTEGDVSYRQGELTVNIIQSH